MSTIKPIEKRLIWLASYPKSGNTWFRIFLGNLLKKETETWSIYDDDAIFSSFTTEGILDLDLDDFSEENSVIFRLKAYEFLNDSNPKNQYIKIHDAYCNPNVKSTLLPTNRTKVAIYIIRNPFAVATSMANFYKKSIDVIIEKYINNKKGGLATNKQKAVEQMEQYLGTWDSHADSWTSQNTIPVHVIRYEDMIENPMPTFFSAMNAIGLNFTEKAVANAIENSSFEKLQQLEEEKNFKESPSKTVSFFNKGKIDYWKKILTQDQIESIIKVNHKMMTKYGYLP